jgi:hypothetical protein
LFTTQFDIFLLELEARPSLVVTEDMDVNGFKIRSNPLKLRKSGVFRMSRLFLEGLDEAAENYFIFGSRKLTYFRRPPKLNRYFWRPIMHRRK